MNDISVICCCRKITRHRSFLFAVKRIKDMFRSIIAVIRMKPFITRRDFDAVQALLRQRSEKVPTRTPISTPFQQKFYCRHCGWRYHLIRSFDPPRWSCSKKGRAGNQCPCRTYLDDDVQNAFLHMYNCLRQNEKVLLDDTIAHNLEI